MRFLRRLLIWLLVIALFLTGAAYANAFFGWMPLPWLQLPGMPQSTDSTMIDGVMVEGVPMDVVGMEGVPPEGMMAPSGVPVQRADVFLLDLKVNGKLEFRTINEIKAPFEETVTTVDTELGKSVGAGDTIATLDRAKLSTQLDEAWRELNKERQALADLMKSSDIELMEANAEVLTAQEELGKLEKGPAAADSKSAQLAITEAQLAYEELVKRNDPNSQKVREARYALRQAETAVQNAQSKYDAISWRGDIAASGEAAALQGATFGLEAAQRTYDEAIKPPSDLELQKAQLAISQAQATYNKLFVAATPAQIELAKVRVAKAEEKVAQLQQGPSSTKVQEAESKVLDALNKFETVRAKLLNASNLQAPISGQIVKLSVKPGQVVKQGDTIAAVADPTQFKLVLPVSELYILRIDEGMEVQLTLDVLPDQIITGTVAGFVPAEVQLSSDPSNSSGSAGIGSLTTYPVIVTVTDSEITQNLRAGMSAQATFVGTNGLEPNSWLVPENAVQTDADGKSTVQVLRGDTPETLEVTLTTQRLGEYVVIVSADLTEADMVVGTTTSFLAPPGTGPGFGPPG